MVRLADSKPAIGGSTPPAHAITFFGVWGKGCLRDLGSRGFGSNPNSPILQ
jgi:hypothetical protein